MYMYIHLGGEKMIRSSEIIAIFDISIEQSSKISKRFAEQAIKEKKFEYIGEDEKKSIVIAKEKVYFSPISSATLKKRVQVHHFLT